jgi:Ca2+-binding RTX toxin-like protein
MAVFRAVQATDMRSDLRLGFLQDFGRTEITFTDATFEGAFTFFGLPTLGIYTASGFSAFPRKPGIGGSLTGYDQDRAGVTKYSVDRVDVDASDAFRALRSGDTDLFQSLVFAGDDSFRGSRRSDVLLGYGGDDRLWGFDGNDRLYGGRGSDVLYGLDGKDRLYGNSGRDWLWGGDGKDRLYGGSSRDILYGENGKDLLAGGTGQDSLSGGANDDVFRYYSVADSRPGSSRRDTIQDMREGDLIDLKGVDGDTGARGNQSLVFIGNAEFSGDGNEVRFDRSDRLVQADTDGDGKAELEIKLKGSFIPHADDFIL